MVKTNLNSILFIQKLQHKYQTLISKLISLLIPTNSMPRDTNCYVTINVIIRDTPLDYRCNNEHCYKFCLRMSNGSISMHFYLFI